MKASARVVYGATLLTGGVEITAADADGSGHEQLLARCLSDAIERAKRRAGGGE